MGRLTPGEAKHKLCVQCTGGQNFNAKLVDECEGDKAKSGACPIYPYRNGERMSVKVFRKFCLNCMGGSYDAVAECEAEGCPAHQYRFGKNPVLAGRKTNTDALRKYRERARGASNNF